MSYGEGVEPLDFGGFSVACLTGQNGHGKSALLDAITWVLWGEARKAVGQKKPDEGLLRLGADEMLVELIFDLEGERFRVIRSFRKTGRTGRSALELNVYQPEKGEYVSVTGSSLSETQRKINQFLRMDYQTFINSSFLLQGRADEFTRKNAGERKKILSDILGLGKYEEMAALAREQYVALRERLLLIEGELNSLSREAADELVWRQRLQNANESLLAVDHLLKSKEEARQNLQLRVQDLKALAARSAALKAEHRQRLQEQTALAAEIDQVSEQLQHDHELLTEQDSITLGRQRLQAVDAELDSTIAKLKQLRVLEQQAGTARGMIEQEKLGLQKDVAQWRQRLQQLRAERLQAEEVLERHEEITAGHRELLLLQQQDETMENKRLQQEAVLLSLRQVELSVEQARARIQAEEQALNRALAEGDRKLKELGTLQAKHKQMLDRLSELGNLAREMEAVKEQGTTCALGIQRTQDEAARVSDLQKELEEKLVLLSHSDSASCPLCDHPLDEAKQQELRQSLQAERYQLSVRMEKLKAGLRHSLDERDQLRAHYADLAQQTKLLPEVQRSVADIEAALQQLFSLEQDLFAKRASRDKLRVTLEQGDFAEAEKSQLAECQQRLVTIAYDGRQHQQVRQSVRRLQDYVVQMHQLQSAEALATRLDEEAAGLVGRLLEWEQKLQKEAYAAGARTELLRTEGAIERIGYDAERHKNLESQRQQLQPYNDRYRELTVALERVASLQHNLARRRGQQQVLQRKLAELATSMAELTRLLQDLPQVEEQLVVTTQEMETARRVYETTLAQQIEAQAGLDRCNLAKARIAELDTQSTAFSRERMIYEKLVAAFGKDGIPALIIENAIPEIEELANEVLDRLTGGRARITIEPLRDKKSGGTKETLDIRISDDLGTRDYELFSGGEAFRTDFAIRMALSKLLARRAGTRLQTLVIDEGFGTQDAEGLEHMIEAIQSVREDFEKIIVVTHLDALKNAFPVRIEVVKHPETGSRFRVVHL